MLVHLLVLAPSSCITHSFAGPDEEVSQLWQQVAADPARRQGQVQVVQDAGGPQGQVAQPGEVHRGRLTAGLMRLLLLTPAAGLLEGRRGPSP